MIRSPTQVNYINHDVHMVIELLLHDPSEKYSIEIVSFMFSKIYTSLKLKL